VEFSCIILNTTDLVFFIFIWRPILCSNYTIYQFTSANRQLFLTLLLDHHVPIERAKGYKYLGVYLRSSGSSAEAKEDLYKRGLKALFKSKEF
jgi:hypothetical protein